MIQTTNRLTHVRNALDAGKKRPTAPGATPTPAPIGNGDGKGGFHASIDNPRPVVPDGTPNDQQGPPPTPAGTNDSHGDGKGGFGGSVDNPTPVVAGTTFDQPPPPPAPSVDAREEQFINDLFGGKYDINTADEKALIAQLFGDQTGKALVNSRASRGRAGLGGGIGAAVEGDVRRKAAQAQQQAEFGLDKDALQRAFDVRKGGVGLDIDLRNQGLDESLIQGILGALGGDPEAPAAAPPKGHTFPGAAETDEQSHQNVADGFYQPGQAVGQAKKPDPSWDFLGYDPNGNVYWQTPQGIYMTPKGTAPAGE